MISAALIFFGYFLLPTQSLASGIGDLSLLDPSILGLTVPQSVANALVQSAGNYCSHRSYQGATALAQFNSIDLFVETTLVKVGDPLFEALEQQGLDSSSARTVPALPIAKAHLRKSFGNRSDFGASGLIYKNIRILGGDIKFNLFQPEEGPGLAIRLAYTNFQIPIAFTRGQVWGLELLTSKALSFAEPYLGIGARYLSGTVSIAQTPVPGGPTIQLPEAKGSAFDPYATMGIFFRIFGAQGLRLGMEGSYSVTGFHTVGMVFGLGI